jgi:4-cresol dehydrogenase (hydroxylating)
MVWDDVGGYAARRVAGTARPGSLSDVQDLVRQASADRPVYPISTGRNWGLGSAQPVTDDCTVVDLSGLNSIRTLDMEAGYAVIEPGVTQRQFAEALRDTGWLVNPTSSCADTSVIGNALERGDGCLRPRTRDVLGVEAVLADGSVLTTGGLDRFSHYRGLVAGPDLTGAMVQSNLGVITAMAISLISRPEAISLFVAQAPAENVGRVIAALARLVRGRLPTTGLPLAANLFVRPSGSFGATATGVRAVLDDYDTDSFTVLVPMLGSLEAVALAQRMVRAELSGLVLDPICVDALTVDPEDPLFAWAGLASGIPTCSVVQNTFGIETCDVDAGPRGFLALMPLLPATPAAVRAVIDAVGEAFEEHPVALAAIEWNMISPHHANGVVQLMFDRDTDSVARAHRMRERLRHSFTRLGFPAYRSDIDHASHELVDRPEDGMVAVATRLKAALDPRGVIAPSRYVPVAVPAAI